MNYAAKVLLFAHTDVQKLPKYVQKLVYVRFLL